jgi:hypothetical protein
MIRNIISVQRYSPSRRAAALRAVVVPLVAVAVALTLLTGATGAGALDAPQRSLSSQSAELVDVEPIDGDEPTSSIATASRTATPEGDGEVRSVRHIDDSNSAAGTSTTLSDRPAPSQLTRLSAEPAVVTPAADMAQYDVQSPLTGESAGMTGDVDHDGDAVPADRPETVGKTDGAGLGPVVPTDTWWMLTGSLLLNGILGSLVIASWNATGVGIRLYRAFRPGRQTPPGETDDGDGAGQAQSCCSNEERVRQLLERNGGSLPQSEIVESTDWSKAKVSRLLSDMETADEVVKRQFGRQNRIWLAGHQPEMADPVSSEDHWRRS